MNKSPSAEASDVIQKRDWRRINQRAHFGDAAQLARFGKIDNTSRVVECRRR
jgi:hypothetical protein